MTFFLDQYFYLHIKRRLFLPFPCSRAEKVPYQARVCVKDSFVKCWQQPQQAVPSQSSPPRRPGAQQGSPAWPGLGWALLAGLGHSEDGTLGTLGTAPSFAPGTPCWSRACSLWLSPPRELPAQKQRGSVCLQVPAPPNCSHDLNTFTHFTSSTPWEKEVIKKFAEGCAGGTKQTARIRSPITSPFANPLNHLPPLSFFNTTF